jgi:L-asparaginase
MAALPKVRLLGTGGTISYAGRHRLDMVGYAEHGHQVTIREMLARIPEVQSIAQVETEQLYEEDYVRLAVGSVEWPNIARRCNELFQRDSGLSGVAITHGSAVMEETAYFLNLTVRSDRPVVVTASQRPSTAMSTDGDINLLDAIRVAGAQQSRGKGVLTVLNNEIHASREVTKGNTFRLETFHPKELGFLGYCDSDGQVVFYRSPTRRHTRESEFDVSSIDQLPRVEIVYVYGGADGLVVEALMDRGIAGLVIATMGSGAMPPAMQKAVAKAVEGGMVVVLSSRAGNGRVILTPGIRQRGLVVADNLTAQKARILLMLGLTVTREQGRLQEMFYTY